MDIYEKLFNYNTQLNINANKTLLEVYKNITETDFIHFIPAVRFDSALFLNLISSLLKPKNILEIGFGSGVSAYFIQENHKTFNNFFTLEKDKSRYERGLKIIDKYNMNQINLIHCDALDYISNNSDVYDFIFLDAGKNDYSKYLNLIKDKLSIGGVLICDNTFFNGNVVMDDINISKNHKKPTKSIKEFNSYLSEIECLNTTFIAIGDGMSISIKT